MPMVKETRTLFEVTDLRNLRLACGSCGTEMLFPPHQNREIPKKCPYCPAEWVDDLATKNPAWDKAVLLLQTIAYLSSLETSPVRLRLEFDGEPETKSG